MNRMRVSVAAAAISVISLTAPVHAQPWRSVERRCVVGLPSNCGSCSAQWTAVAGCVASVTYPAAGPDRIQECLERVGAADENQPMAFDRTPDVLRCVAGK